MTPSQHTAVTYRHDTKSTYGGHLQTWHQVNIWRSPTDMTPSQHMAVTYRHDTKSTYGGHLQTWHRVNQTAVTYRHNMKSNKRRSPTDMTSSQLNGGHLQIWHQVNQTAVTYRHNMKSTKRRSPACSINIFYFLFLLMMAAGERCCMSASPKTVEWCRFPSIPFDVGTPLIKTYTCTRS